MVDAEKAFADVQAFTAGAHSLIKDMTEGSAPDASKEAQTRAAMAARSVMRNTPHVVQSLVRLGIAAEDLIATIDERRAGLMDAVFGPDQT